MTFVNVIFKQYQSQVNILNEYIQSNWSTRISHRELQKWPLLTGGLYSKH